MAEFTATITNPNLFGKFWAGQEFYVDFTEAFEMAFPDQL
jgi:hypothetical protein